MRSSDRDAKRRNGAMRRLASVGAVGLVVAACAGCTPRQDDVEMQEYGVTNATDQTLELGSQIIAAGQTRMFETAGCVSDLELRTKDGTQAVMIDRVCGLESVKVTQEDLYVLSSATVVNTSRVRVFITFDDAYPKVHKPVDPGESLVLTIVGKCVADVTDPRPESTLYATAILDERQDEVTLVHTGPLCRGGRWVIDDGTLDAGVATVTLTNTTTFPMEARVDDASWIDPVRLRPGASADVRLGVPVDACLDKEISLEVGGADEPAIAGTVAGPLCDGQVAITAEMLRRRDETGNGWSPLTATETNAAVRVVNQTGSELVLEVGGPAPYTVSVGVGSSATLILGVPTTECLDASLRASTVPGTGETAGPGGTAELPGPLCGGEWVVTADLLVAAG